MTSSLDNARQADAQGARSHVGWVSSTHFAQGLPYSLVHKVVAQEYFVSIGMDPAAIGMTSLLHLPWVFKFLWTPVVARFSTAKRWQIGTQITLAGLVLAGAMFCAARSIDGVVSVLIALALVAATNDIAIDTYYLRALKKPEQAALSGARIAAYRAALFLGNGAIVTFAGFAGFDAALVVSAGILLVAALVHAIILRGEEVNETAEGSGSWGLFASVATLLARPGIVPVLGFVLTFRAGDAIMFAMSSQLLSELGLDVAQRGLYGGMLGTAASIAGSMAGAATVSRWSLERTLVPIAWAQSLAILLYVLMAAARPPLWGIVTIVLAEQWIAGMGTAAFVVFNLRLSDGPHKATHFAVVTALFSIAVTGAGAASGFLYKALGPTGLFSFAYAASLPGVAMSHLVRRSRR
jgi:PAT family beta-lactamase induction signal transducer AmpG